VIGEPFEMGSDQEIIVLLNEIDVLTDAGGSGLNAQSRVILLD